VYVVRDAEARDKYKRLLAYVYRTADNLFVNLSLVSGGFAVPLSIAPNTAHENDFVVLRNINRLPVITPVYISNGNPLHTLSVIIIFPSP
jgi:hypothetical protein